MCCGIQLPAIQLPQRRIGSRTASASSSLRIGPPNQTKAINKAGVPRRNRKGGIILNKGILLTPIEGGGSGALAGERGGGLAVLPLVALEHLAHGCLPATRVDLESRALITQRKQPGSGEFPPDRAGGGGEFDGRGRGVATSLLIRSGLPRPIQRRCFFLRGRPGR
jgi:hypothetical protein